MVELMEVLVAFSPLALIYAHKQGWLGSILKEEKTLGAVSPARSRWLECKAFEGQKKIVRVRPVPSLKISIIEVNGETQGLPAPLINGEIPLDVFYPKSTGVTGRDVWVLDWDTSRGLPVSFEKHYAKTAEEWEKLERLLQVEEASKLKGFDAEQHTKAIQKELADNYAKMQRGAFQKGGGSA
ncbi:MAG: hypothetical protein ACE5DI_03990 [Candidatus Micrarchaeia archaeon]